MYRCVIFIIDHNGIVYNCIVSIYVLTVVYRTTSYIHKYIQYSRLYYWLTFNETSNSRLTMYALVSWRIYFNVVYGNHVLYTCKEILYNWPYYSLL